MTTKSLLSELKKLAQSNQDYYKEEVNPNELIDMDSSTFKKLEDGGVIAIEGDKAYIQLAKKGSLSVGEESSLSEAKDEADKGFLVFVNEFLDRIEKEKDEIRKDSSLEEEEKKQLLEEKKIIASKVKEIISSEASWHYLTSSERNKMIEMADSNKKQQERNMELFIMIMKRFAPDWIKEDTDNLPFSIYKIITLFIHNERSGWLEEGKSISPPLTTIEG